MADSSSSTLSVARREPAGSRATRRLRRTGQVPGVIYGGGDEPISFEVNSRTLRNFLAHAGAVVELSVDGDTPTPVMVKELVRHPVTAETMHVDLLRVDMKVSIQSTIVVDLVGAEEAPGVTMDGGVFTQVTREVTIEALPGDIPDTLQHDVSGMGAADTLTVADLKPPAGVTVVDDPETIIATIATPSSEEPSDEIETETEVVGEGEAAAEAAAEESEAPEAEGATGDDAASAE